MSGYVVTIYRSHNPLLAAGHGIGAVWGSSVTGGVMADLKAYLPVVLVTVVLVCLVLIIRAGRETVQRLSSEVTTVTQERDEARRVLSNQQRTLQIFAQISKAGTDEKQRNQADNDAIRAEIRPVLAAEPAARVVVPAAVTERVRSAISAVRPGSSGSASR